MFFSLQFTVSKFEVQSDSICNGETNCGLQNDVCVNQSDNQKCNEYPKFGEASPDDYLVKHTPKPGVLKKINIFLTRIFTSKL